MTVERLRKELDSARTAPDPREQESEMVRGLETVTRAVRRIGTRQNKLSEAVEALSTTITAAGFGFVKSSIIAVAAIPARKATAFLFLKIPTAMARPMGRRSFIRGGTSTPHMAFASCPRPAAGTRASSFPREKMSGS